jgi:hypothetical protein
MRDVIGKVPEELEYFEKANVLVGMTKLEQAAGVYQEMLALNPRDNQGITEELLDVAGQLESLEALGGPPWWEKYEQGQA